MKLAVIPARGGSKRISRKNIRVFEGQPIIAYSIQAALASECFDVVMVSTDDVEIAEIAQNLGAEVPFIRPAELSNDTAGTVEVIQHAVSFYQDRGQVFERVCCIYATAPFISSVDLVCAHRKLCESEGLDYVFPVTAFSYPVQRALTMSPDECVHMLHPELQSTRSQDLVETYHDAGQFYWGTAEAFLSARPIVGGYSKAIVIPRERTQDIDTEEDWAFAQILFKLQKREVNES